MSGEEKQSSHVKVATASLIGTTIEWYDFFLYGTAAALVFNKLFFPTFDPMMGTLLASAGASGTSSWMFTTSGKRASRSMAAASAEKTIKGMVRKRASSRRPGCANWLLSKA